MNIYIPTRMYFYLMIHHQHHERSAYPTAVVTVIKTILH